MDGFEPGSSVEWHDHSAHCVPTTAPFFFMFAFSLQFKVYFLNGLDEKRSFLKN